MLTSNLEKMFSSCDRLSNRPFILKSVFTQTKQVFVNRVLTSMYVKVVWYPIVFLLTGILKKSVMCCFPLDIQFAALTDQLVDLVFLPQLVYSFITGFVHREN